jgi:hypothetical protein
MSRKSEYVEMAFGEAGNVIQAFFADGAELLSVFESLCQRMLAVSGDFIIRAGENIIGLCRAGEFYRFYVLKENGQYCIKFQHYTRRIDFDVRALDLYLADCDRVNEYFEKYISRLVLRSEIRRQRSEERRLKAADNETEELVEPSVTEHRRKRKRFPYDSNIWEPVRSAVADALAREPDCSVVFTAVSRQVYTEFVEILTALCLDTEIMRGNAGEILIERVIYYRRSTLEELGERYGVTRERVRQVQNKKWQLASRLISKYRTAYTERLVELFLGLEGSELIGAIAYIGYKNKFLGDQLVQLASTAETRSALEFILHRMR